MNHTQSLAAPDSFDQESTTLSITLHLDVWNPHEFAATAIRRGVAEGLEESDAESSAYPQGRAEQPDLSWCAKMVFDPGESPQGSTILDSDVAL